MYGLATQAISGTKLKKFFNDLIHMKLFLYIVYYVILIVNIYKCELEFMYLYARIDAVF